jgi:arylsulfate sulfotransferase
MHPRSHAALALLSLLLFTIGCGTSEGTGGYPISSSVSGTSHPLVASYTITPSKPGLVSIEFGPTTEYGLSTAQQHTPAGFLLTNLLVAGMKANTTYHMRARVEYDDGSTAMDTDHTFLTGSVPPGLLPAYTVTATPGLTPQPGVELVNTLGGGAGSTAFATDLDGNVIWYYPFADRSSSSIYPMKLLPNGHLMCIVFPQSSLPGVSLPPNVQAEIREIDLAGNLIRHLTMQDLNARLAAANFNITLQLFHHDFTLLPNGHILVGSPWGSPIGRIRTRSPIRRMTATSWSRSGTRTGS